MSRTDEFEELRPLLFAIAYRLLGSVSDAEDALQEAWVRYSTATVEPRSPRASLSAVVTRLALNTLRSARVRREEPIGGWLPEPLLEDPYQDPERAAELADSVSMAALLLLERLSPLERAVFVLRDVFGFGFDEIASTVGRSEVACRQLATRARRPMQAGRPRFEPDRHLREELASRFFEALETGDVHGIRELLATDVEIVSDGGGKAPTLPSGVVGAEHVTRLLASVAPRFAQIELAVEPHEVNGQPGALVRERRGLLLAVLLLDIVDGRIQTLRSVIDPDKLRHLGPVADAWVVDQEFREATRNLHRS